MRNTPAIPDLLAIAASAADWWVGMLTSWPAVSESYIARRGGADAALVEDPDGRMLTWSLVGAGIVTVAEVTAVGDRLRVTVGGFLTQARFPVVIRHVPSFRAREADPPAPTFTAPEPGTPMQIDPLTFLMRHGLADAAEPADRPFLSATLADWVMAVNLDGTVGLWLADAASDRIEVTGQDWDTAARRLWDRRLWRAAVTAADVLTRGVRAMVPDGWADIDDGTHQAVTAVVALWIRAAADADGVRTPDGIDHLHLNLVYSVRELPIADLLAATEISAADLGGDVLHRLAQQGVPAPVADLAVSILDLLLVMQFDKRAGQQILGDPLRFWRPRPAVGPHLATGI